MHIRVIKLDVAALAATCVFCVARLPQGSMVGCGPNVQLLCRVFGMDGSRKAAVLRTWLLTAACCVVQCVKKPS